MPRGTSFCNCKHIYVATVQRSIIECIDLVALPSGVMAADLVGIDP